MTIDPGFQPVVAHLDVAALQATPDVVYLLDAECRLRGFNPAWAAFARHNGGDRVLEDFVVGRSVLDAIPDVLRAYYRKAYRHAIETGSRFDHDYECSSSPTTLSWSARRTKRITPWPASTARPAGSSSRAATAGR